MTRSNPAKRKSVDPAPLAVDPSKLRAVILSLLLSVSTILGAVSTVLSFVETRDLAGMIVWLKSDTGLQALGAIVLLAGLLATMLRSFVRQAREIFLASNVDDGVAVVKRVPVARLIAPPPPPAGGAK
jgi:hypothetical protein